jgi:hypothetical protein
MQLFGFQNASVFVSPVRFAVQGVLSLLRSINPDFERLDFLKQDHPADMCQGRGKALFLIFYIRNIPYILDQRNALCIINPRKH